MTDLQRQQIKKLIPDLLPTDHIPLNIKRTRFIQGQGIVLYNDTFAVEIYIPRLKDDKPVFFGVQRHYGKINELKNYFRRPRVLSYNDRTVSDEIKRQFDEALFHFQPMTINMNAWTLPKKPLEQHSKKTIEVFMNGNLSGAA